MQVYIKVFVFSVNAIAWAQTTDIIACRFCCKFEI